MGTRRKISIWVDEVEIRVKEFFLKLFPICSPFFLVRERERVLLSFMPLYFKSEWTQYFIGGP